MTLYKPGVNGAFTRTVIDIFHWQDVSMKNVIVQGTETKDTVKVWVNDTSLVFTPEKDRIVKGECLFEITNSTKYKDFLTTYQNYLITRVAVLDFGGLKHIELGGR